MYKYKTANTELLIVKKVHGKCPSQQTIPEAPLQNFENDQSMVSDNRGLWTFYKNSRKPASIEVKVLRT